MDRAYLTLILTYFQGEGAFSTPFKVYRRACRHNVIEGMSRSVGHSACIRTRYDTILMVRDNGRIICQCLPEKNISRPQHAAPTMPQNGYC